MPLVGVEGFTNLELKCLISREKSLRRSSSPDFPIFTKRNLRAKSLQYNQVQSFPPSMDLSDNHLNGTIWPEFGNLKDLMALDLSGNNLSGIIPAELSGMKNLENLDLSHNNLIGTIPTSLTGLNFLSSFSVAYNDLHGLIPLGGQFSTFPSTSFEGNRGLCGEDYSNCSDQRSPSLELGNSIRRKKNKSVILGITIGIVSGAVLILAIAYIFVDQFWNAVLGLPSTRFEGDGGSAENTSNCPSQQEDNAYSNSMSMESSIMLTLIVIPNHLLRGTPFTKRYAELGEIFIQGYQYD
ncbi:Phytosulfokine receptor 1 [Acorus calamus]|uniref:Phytosulfokine receptor 1 n=1 Tax=Acorus calamus TaxID=4465 RepID=A0AAV9FKA7_ACOCL|nr:Phytosulfokine receptor 1 [Acorus calamus]